MGRTREARGVRYLAGENVESVEVRGNSAEQALKRLGRYIDQYESFRLVGLDLCSGDSEELEQFVLARDPEVVAIVSYTV